MKLRQLLIVILFLPQLALAQKPGVVSDTVPCKKSAGHTYALYLPKSYTGTTPVGLILFFDPGARGRMPIDLYKSLADKYSVIIACSNNSRNGAIDVSLRAGNATLADLQERFNINRKLIITSGFSGGGRVASDLALKNRTIAGVIACGAAFSSDKIKVQDPLPFAEVIGELDMNYQEALQANEYLKTIHNPALLTFFYGGHQWPPLDAYEQAIAWHLLRIDPTNELKRQAIAKTLKNAQVKVDSGYMFEASHILRQMLGEDPVDSMFAIVQKDKRTRIQSKDAQKISAYELRKKQEFGYAYTRHMAYAAPDSAYHPQFWKMFRRDCDKLVGGDRYEKRAGLRLIDYGWRLCAEQYYFFVNDGTYRQAAMSARIWSLIQPDNPYPSVQAARAFALQKRKEDMLDYLRQAVSRGLKDKQAVMKDPDFAAYAGDADFRAVFR